MNRIYRYCLLFLLLSFSSNFNSAYGSANESPRKETVKKVKHKKGMNVAGRVTVDGQPRRGVVVSDGISVVTTNSKGEYQLSSPMRQHVFVSVPADCEIPIENGMPKIYKQIEWKAGDKQQIDFELKGKEKLDGFKLYVVADVQIGGKKDIADWKENILPGMKELTESLGENVYGISLGDIVWNAPNLYPTYINTISQISVPVFSVIGNHDHNEITKGDIHSDQEFRDALGPTYYSCNIGDWHIVALDDVVYSGEENRNDYKDEITQEQLDWLKEDLKHVDKSKSILVGVHVPTSTPTNLNRLTNSSELHSLLKDFAEVQILSGHTHRNFQTDIAENMHETTFGSLMGAFWNTRDGVGICSDGSPRGHAVMEFSGNKLVDKYYMGCETPRDYQLKIYLPDEASFRFGKDQDENPIDTDMDHLLVNIFFWNPNWKVEVKEDEKDWMIVPASKFEAIPDPLAVKNLQGKNKWEVRPSAEPSPANQHMFLYRPANENWSTFSVRATDPYGNVYNSSVNSK